MNLLISELEGFSILLTQYEKKIINWLLQIKNAF
ncbi:hypothetical protein CTO_0973 [Chlamydia trachomatis A2497]|uniref:Uncharacterized protein n=1 Tax=Chlamydia trachomatis serovar A (strain A2497) TaxID=580047 RepID=G4NMY9_CHLT4|nr:hypothetical protein G11222_02070 [Chlamydia trachomatis G/11222]ADH19943.1 hypothetical protein G11074_02070 [Chlamydia trachomatis G/11074]ADH97040.1 hypothetical protein CTG9301_02075 [Chlamydia trachomatis G/9301]AEP35253.1 hypothetical protein CTO_0973 [Chlamydia trachomatis A2497]AGS02201.1 hypothetical protein CTJTET1_02095 [Chlamydia trachomatis J/6276tet1]AGT71363.1 hypothetical protein O178_02180 [Chlamydia trachomatis]AHC17245.1 hypothetical protein CTW3_02190 [Chlamydia trachom